MSADDRSSTARADRPPHPATLSRTRAVQPKLANGQAPHPATLSRARAVQPKLANGQAPHPATLPRTRAVQPKLANGQAPHPATASIRSAARTRLVSDAPHPATAQPKKKKIGKMRAGMQKGKANPNNQQAKQQSKAERSFNNLKWYRPGWVRENGITVELIRAFIKTYKEGIRGHASDDNNQGEQGNTTADCNAYKSWHTQLYGWQ